MVASVPAPSLTAFVGDAPVVLPGLWTNVVIWAAVVGFVTVLSL